MAIAVTVAKRTVFGDQRVVFADIVFSGNYATGGEALVAADLGLNVINFLTVDGASPATALTTAVVQKYNYATGKMLSFETGSTSAAPLSEKDNAEAYITGQFCRVMAVGN
jgi:hypothetical protein